MTVHLLSNLSPSQTLRAPISNLHCCIFKAQNLQETGMGFQFCTLFYLILCFSLWFFAYVCDFEMGLGFDFCSLFILSLRILLLDFDVILVDSLLLFILCLAKWLFYVIWTLSCCVVSKCSVGYCEFHCAKYACSIVLICWELLLVSEYWLCVISIFPLYVSMTYICLYDSFSLLFMCFLS